MVSPTDAALPAPLREVLLRVESSRASTWPVTWEHENITIENLKIHSFDTETGILQITGAIPGSRGAVTKITISDTQNK